MLATARTMLAPAVLVAITAVLGVIAYEAAFSTFLAVDDEGYVVVSLQLFNDGGSLYDEVYSQYGPGLFTLVGGLIELAGVPLDSEGARFFNLVVWLASSLGTGVVILRATRNLAISVVGLLLTFFVLSVAGNEPLHPGATIALLLVAMTAAAVVVASGRPRLGLTALGALAVALVSIKVNVGGFAIAALAWALVASLPALRRLRPLLVAVAVGFVAVPWVLTSDLLGDGSTRRYATLVSSGALALVLASRPLAEGSLPRVRDLVWLAGGAVAVLLLVLAVPIIQGTSPAQLIDGWLVRPAETPERQFAAATFHQFTYLWSFLGVAAALIAATALASRRRLGRGGTAAVAALRIAFGLIVWLSLSGPLLGLAPELTKPMFVAVPFVWVVALAPEGAPLSNRFARCLIAGLAVLQALHAFPVGGSQLAWSHFLLITVAALCVADGIHQLRALGPLRGDRGPSWSLAASAAVVVMAIWFCLGPLADYSNRIRDAYSAGVSPGLAGTERLRIASGLAAELRSVTETLQNRCRTFISLPGLNSFYLFAGLRPPTVLSGPWPHFLTADDQREIVDRVDDTERLCVVLRPEGAEFWASLSGYVIPNLPLVRFIEREFEPIAARGGYVVEARPVPGEGGQ